MKKIYLFITIFLLLPILAYTVYAPGLNGPFVFDDRTNITNNALIRIKKIDFEGLYLASISGEAGPLKRPVAMASFALNYYFADGYSEYAFKLTNLIIQILCGFLMISIGYRVFCLGKNRQNENDRTIALLFGTIAGGIWLIHPVNLTSVLYAVQRMTSLSTLFSLGCVALYLHARITHREHHQNLSSLLYVLSSLTCATLAIFSKENALIIPLLIAWAEYTLFSNSEIYKPVRLLPKPWKGFLYTLLSLISLISLVWMIDYASFGYQNRPFTMVERVLTETRVLCFYIGLAIIPRINAFGLFHDDLTLSTSLISPWTTPLAILFLLSMFIAAFYFRKEKPLLAFGIGWFFIGHALESTFFPLEIAHEHRNHLPSVGLIIALASLIPISKLQNPKSISLLACVFLLLGSTTWLRANQWSDYYTLSFYEAEHHPESPAIQAMFSNASYRAGNYIDSAIAIKKAMDLAPSETSYALHYQNILAISGQTIPKQLQEETIRRIRINLITPSTELALDHIADCLDKAACKPLIQNYLEWIENIIQKRPNFAYYHYLKGKALRASGYELEALNTLQKAHELDDEYLHPLFEMADILLRAKQFEALEEVVSWIEETNSRAGRPRKRELHQLKKIIKEYTAEQPTQN